jgi:membrane-associated protein
MGYFYPPRPAAKGMPLLPVDLQSFIETVGYIGVALIVFAESGLLVGFFLPGDSLLFTAGFLASQGHFNIWVLATLCFIAAVTGDAVGYYFGHKVGRGLFLREDSRFFKKKYLVRAEEFFERNGGKAIFLARFIPVVRTFTPIVAGAAAMRYRDFFVYNAMGGLAWAVGITVAGYQLGSRIPDVDKYLLPIIAVIIIVSVAPGAWHMYREMRESKREEAAGHAGGVEVNETP